MKITEHLQQNPLPGKDSMSPGRQTEPDAGETATLPVTNMTEVHHEAGRQMPDHARTQIKQKEQKHMDKMSNSPTAATTAANRQMPEPSTIVTNNEQKGGAIKEPKVNSGIFATKGACVSELVSRVLASRLNDEEALTAASNLIKAYREKPRAFNNCLVMAEPLNIEAAFRKSTDPEVIEYWQKVNSALVEVGYGRTDDCDFPIYDFGDEDEIEIDLNGDGSEEITTHFGSIGPIVEGWGLFDRETGTTVPAFFETRSEARELKSPSESVVRVAVFTIDENNSSD